MDKTILLTPVVGAVIGYFTNWLAIKMIFKPYEEKRIFGIKVPFTPGLMAKERYAMSKKIGKTVSTHILTEDTLFDAIANKDFSETVDMLINEFKTYLVNNENSLETEFVSKFENYELYRENIKDVIIKEFMKYINNPLIKEEIVSYVTNTLLKNLEDKDNIEALEKFLALFLDNINAKGQNFGDKLKNDDRKIVDIINIEGISKFKDIIEEILPDILVRLRFFIENGKGSGLDIEIEKLFKKIIVDSYGKFASALINPEKLYENGKINFIEFISHNQNEIFEKINKFIDDLSSKEVREIAKKFPENSCNNLVQETSNLFKKAVGNQISGTNIVELIKKTFPDMGIRTKNYVYKVLNGIIEKKADLLFERMAELCINNIEKVTISSIGLKLNTIDLRKIKILLESAMKTAIKKSGSTFLRGIDIQQLVESKINTLEIKEMEDIVVTVANKEIKSITIVGGVLGFLIGLVPLITTLFK